MLRSELGREVFAAAAAAAAGGGFFLGGGASGSRPLDSRFLRLSRLLRFVPVPPPVPPPGAAEAGPPGPGAGDSRGVPGELTSDGGPEVAIVQLVAIMQLSVVRMQ